MAAFKPSKILIFGGTGTIGKYITSSLLKARPAFSQVVLFTSPTSSPAKTAQLTRWRAAGISVVEGSVENAADVSAAYGLGIDTVICALGRGALHTEEALLRQAEESGTVQWFLPSEFGTDVEYGPSSANEKPHQFKRAVRAFVREKVSRMKVTYIVTGPYFEMWLDALSGAENAGGFDVAAKKAYLIDNGVGKIGFCTMPE
jgi:hypothetical protein